MLSHKIIVHKELVQVPTYNYTSKKHTTPIVHTPPFNRINVVNSQLEFTNYVVQHPIVQDTYVVYRSVANPILAQISYILYLEANFDKLQHSWDRGHPCYLRLMSCTLGTPTPWVRWDSQLDYRVINNEEYRTYIEPNLDQLSHRIQECRKSNPT